MTAHIGAYSRYVHLAGGATMGEPLILQPTAVRVALNRQLRLSAPICAVIAAVLICFAHIYALAEIAGRKLRNGKT